MEKKVNSTVRIKEVIPHGGIKEVAAASNTSIHTVGRVIRGTSNNIKVIKALDRYLKKISNTKNQLSRTVDALTAA